MSYESIVMKIMKSVDFLFWRSPAEAFQRFCLQHEPNHSTKQDRLGHKPANYGSSIDGSES